MSRLLICGLGNPGPQYKNHRHSLGLIILDALRLQYRYSSWIKDAKCQGYWQGADSLQLFKSNVFMNLSGRAVSRAYRKLGGENWGRLCVVHDDLELPVGTTKFRERGMGGGHNGIRSCISSLNTDEFLRISVGIGRPESRDPEMVSQYVLSGMTPFERDIIEKKTIPAIIAHLDALKEDSGSSVPRI